MREKDLDTKTAERLATLLSLGDPTAEVALAHRVKEADENHGISPGSIIEIPHLLRAPVGHWVYQKEAGPFRIGGAKPTN